MLKRVQSGKVGVPVEACAVLVGGVCVRSLGIGTMDVEVDADEVAGEGAGKRRRRFSCGIRHVYDVCVIHGGLKRVDGACVLTRACRCNASRIPWMCSYTSRVFDLVHKSARARLVPPWVMAFV